MKRLLSFLVAMVSMTATLPVHAASLVAGDLIKASGPAVYYYAQDGKRYVFPTEKTYKSWYVNFNTVKTVTDSELAAISIGGNVTYRPGVRLVKVTTDPKVYAVDGKNLRWVNGETTAKTIFGDDWAKQVDDLPDPFFVNYKLGAEIDNAADYAPADVRNTYATIQATITASVPVPTPTPTPTPSPTPTPTSTTLGVTITTDKSTAQPNEKIYILANTTFVGSMDRFEIYADDGLLNTCHAASCSGTWTVPVAGVKAAYQFRAKLITGDARTGEATTSTTIISQPYHASIEMRADRKVVKSGQAPNIRAAVTSGLTSDRTEIYMNGTVVKACETTPNDCRYNDYVFGTIGSTHEFYAVVRTPSSLFYKSKSIIITIGENDVPTITMTSGKSEILAGEMVDVGLTAQDDDGISQTVISKDGQAIKTCAGAAPCTINTGPWNVSAGTVLTFTGMATDLKGLNATSTVSVTVK